MPILLGIDGTGTRDHAQYAATFRTGFVRKICWKPSQNTKYIRGPYDEGTGLGPAIDEGVSFILARRRAQPNLPVLLTGYSRGGAGVIVVAERLKHQKIPVAGMMLFDAVDRHIHFFCPTIPENVMQVLHVRRDPSGESRKFFGNCGRQWNSRTTLYREETFLCTHGGMGGTPWQPPKGKSGSDMVEEPPEGCTKISYIQDARVSDQVWNYVEPFVKGMGFI